jgi:hypothetical protein
MVQYEKLNTDSEYFNFENKQQTLRGKLYTAILAHLDPKKCRPNPTKRHCMEISTPSSKPMPGEVHANPGSRKNTVYKIASTPASRKGIDARDYSPICLTESNRGNKVTWISSFYY